MQNLDLYRSAAEMLKQHGEDASVQAAMKSDAMLAKGDMEGAKVWREIVKKIDILRTQKPDGITQH